MIRSVGSWTEALGTEEIWKADGFNYGVFSFANIDGRNHQGCCASLCVACAVAVAVAVASSIANR
jgi:hypothetical protein